MQGKTDFFGKHTAPPLIPKKWPLDLDDRSPLMESFWNSRTPIQQLAKLRS
jgi:hypothetical protein